MTTQLSRALKYSALAAFAIAAPPVFGARYEVGPDQPLKSISEVPWAALEPGDTVAIHWRPAPYKEKWAICRQGTAAKPITVCGIKGPHGELPVIDGEDAVEAKGLDYSGGALAVIKIGSASTPRDCMPAFIALVDLDVENAYPAFSFQTRKSPAKYAQAAAAVWIEKGEEIAIRGCALHGSANGLFVSNNSRHILVDRCRFYGNGVEKDLYKQNSYSEADGIVFQRNHFAPLRPGAPGCNLKDRSAGLVVRDNWIEGGNRALDLVDADDSEALRRLPSYRETYVYRNVLVKLSGGLSNQVVHYGGDSLHKNYYRNGTLYFYNNTVVSKRSDSTTLFRLMSNEEHVDARNNIFYTEGAGKTMAMVDCSGVVNLSGNWIKTDWTDSQNWFVGAIRSEENNLKGEDPGFVNEGGGNYALEANSPCRAHAADYRIPGDPSPAKPVDIGAPAEWIAR